MNLRLAILFFLFLPLLATAQLREFEVRDQPCPEGIVQANAQYFDNALVLVYSSLPDLNFRSSLGGINKVSFNPTANRYEILCSPTKQQILVSSKGFMELRIATINPTPKQVLCYAVEEKLSERLAGKGSVFVDTEPENCMIILNELELAQRTPVELVMPAGVNQLVLRKTGYLDLDTILSVKKDQKVLLDVKLVPGWADLSVRCEPAAASISLNGVSRGKGSLSLKGIAGGLKPGSYDMSVTLDRHRPFQTTLNLRGGDVKQLDVRLEPITGVVHVKSDPVGANVLIDGQKVGVTPLRTELIIGDYRLKVEKAGYKEDSRSFALADGEQKNIDLTLRNYSKVINPLKAAKWTFLSISLAGFGTGGYFLYSSISGYAAYPSATDNAQALREQVQLADVIYPIAFAVAGAALIPTIIYGSKIKRLKKEWGLAAVPVQKGGAVVFSHKF